MQKMSFEWFLDEGKYLTPVEVDQLRKSVQRNKEMALSQHKVTPVKDWFLIELCLHTGLRVQEVADLHWKDIFLENGRSSLLVRSGKGNKPRVVKFSDSLKSKFIEFNDWKHDQNEPIDPSSPIFFSKRTNAPITTRALQKAFKRAANKAGLCTGFSIHSLRHTYATHLLAVSKNLRLVQKQLGHSSLKTTEIYADIISDERDAALNNLYSFSS